MNPKRATSRVVAIDGPGGSGKSTVAKAVGAALGLDVLDTGAMYRAATYAALRDGIDPCDDEAIAALVQRTKIIAEDRVLVDGVDATEAIRGPEVTAAVSAVSANPRVRVIVVGWQQAWIAERGGGVVEGRDIGTVVAPDAMLKIFLDASEEVRARRRQGDELAADRKVKVEQLRADMARRDHLDSSRAMSPLRAASDAVRMDTTGRTVEEVVSEVLALVREAAEVSGEQ